MTKRRTKMVVGVALIAGLLVSARLYANAPDGRFAPVTGGVQDNVTGLIWQQPDDGNSYTWADAQTHCSGTWRLPTTEELITLLDIGGAAAPFIDKAFSNANAAYWSVTTLAGGGPSSAWYVSFANGIVGFQGQVATNRVRCVR